MTKLNNLDSEIQILDEKRQMRNLVNAIKFADSFSLLFVRCNQRPRQKEIIEELVKQLDDYKIKIVFLEHQIEHLLDELQKRLGDEKYDAVFVYGLENSFPKAAEATESPFVVTLNHSRNSFKKFLNCPLVLFLPEYALSAIYHGATDFYSIRSGVYLFSAKAEEIEQLITGHISPDYNELNGFLFEERENRIQSIKQLIDEYESLPHLQRNIEKEISLKERLADIYTISGEYKKAESFYKEILGNSKTSENDPFLVRNLNALGILYDQQQEFDRATKLFNEALEILEKKQLSNTHLYAISLSNLGVSFLYQRKFDKAEKVTQKALKIYQEVNMINGYEYARALNNLASIYQNQGKYKESTKLYEESLAIDVYLHSKNHLYYAQTLNNLATLYFIQGSQQKALSIYKKSYHTFVKILGKNHKTTKQVKVDLENCKIKAREQASILIPYKN